MQRRSFFNFLVIFLIVLTSCTGQNSDQCHHVFKEHGCDCGMTFIRCFPVRDVRSLSEFPVSTQQYPKILTIHIKNGGFTTLNRSHLEVFPSLQTLKIENSALSEIEGDALSPLTFMSNLILTGNQLTEVPNVTDHLYLTQMYLQNNKIRDVSYDKVKGCTLLSYVDLGHNEISVLRNGTFKDSCTLSILDISYNQKLHTIESHFFEGMVVRVLDLSYTNIDHFLAYAGLQNYLETLKLAGCKRLKSFPSARTTYDNHLCTDLTFPFLQRVTFEYHALCCRYQFIKKLTTGGYNASRCTSTRSTPKSSLFSKYKRAVTPNYICLNLTSGTIVAGHTPSISEIFNDTELCESIPFCFGNRCPQNCNNNNNNNNSNNNNMGSGSIQSVEIACVEDVPMPKTVTPSPTLSTLHTTVCWRNGSITSLPSVTATSILSMTTPSPSPSPSPTSTTVTPTPTIDYSECPDDDFDPCLECILDDCGPSECAKYQGYCDAENSKRKRRKREVATDVTCTLIDVTLTPTLTVVCPSTLTSLSPTMPSLSMTTPSPSPSPSPTSTTVTPTPTIDYSECPDDDFDPCLECILDDCEPSECANYQGYCDAENSKRKRRKREVAPQTCFTAHVVPSVVISLTCYDDIPVSSSLSSQQNNDPYCSVVRHTTSNIIIIPSSSSPVPALPSASSTSKTSTSIRSISSTRAAQDSFIGSPTPLCTPHSPIPGTFLIEDELFVECEPMNDPFNPCDDVIDSNLLRAAMWLVILFSIGGNVLVLTVTALHFIIRYIKSHKKPHVMYFLYVNLAIADLFMGIYLLIIAIIDLETMGDYSFHAIEWQTGPGCRFAGFCAILSSMLSVYTLLIITVERVYTIKFALQRKRFNKHYAAISILIGWVVIIVLCILPMVNVSSYERVSICLPFETKDTIDKVYVSSLLILTGIASFIILICYCILFYLVTCNRKHLLQKSMSGREELKLAFRMSLLVLTDFACWAPIAFFGLTAAFQAPLLNVHHAKILMVFIFPINSCLNPILYSFSTRRFQSIFSSLFAHCGLCKNLYKERQSSSGVNRRSSEDILKEYNHGGKQSTQISLLSRFSSFSSFTKGSQESRRGSTVSGSSNEVGTHLQNIQCHPDLPSGLRSKRNSQSSESSFSSEPGAEILLGYQSDRKISLASLSGHVPQLTVLAEEKEEDIVSMKSHWDSTESSESGVNIQLQYTAKPHDDMTITGTAVTTLVQSKESHSFSSGVKKETRPHTGKEYGLQTADVPVCESYSNAYIDELDDTPYSSQQLEIVSVIETVRNETNGTEYQQQKITFTD